MICGVYINSSIMEGALIKTSSLQGRGLLHSNQTPLRHLRYLVSLIILSYKVLQLFAKNVMFYQVRPLLLYIVHTTYLIIIDNKKI